MTQDQNADPVTAETNPPQTNVYGPPHPGFGVPPPSYSQVPAGAYPPPPGYGQPSFPSANAQFAPGPYPQMPYPQGFYPQGPYPQGFSGNPSGEIMKQKKIISLIFSYPWGVIVGITTF